MRNRFSIFLFIIFSAFVFSQTALSQELTNEQKKAVKKARKEQKIAEGRLMIMPLAGPAYTPELEFTLAGGVMMSFKTNRQDSLIQRSSSPIMLGISSTGAYFFGTKMTTFWLQDKIRMYGDFNFKDMPDNYWGVGYDKGRNTVKSDSTTAFTRSWWQIYPRILWQFKKNYFGGLVIDYNYTRGRDASAGVSSDSYYTAYNNKPLNSGLGLIFQYDSRDVPVNAWEGWFFELSATLYRSGFGGDNNYEIYVADLRKYWTIQQKKGRTFAAQVKGRFGTGNVPYGEMSQLGTPFDLRGYTWGRYRNNTMWFALAEYRHMFYKANGDISKHGFVGWLGAGTIGEDVTSFANYLPNFGVGYRLEVQPRMNLRVDFGFGTETFGFYFNFNEAF